eukprot:TRINITY_DN2035_c0_g2_i1.p1 TRINITY_DN2035_c0_g2~~TRINITY_DN2035_c0_g2_i1.p1  ORF type:complete len:5128 (+),score=954.32 TRINITY_DN2035_c0_g2_i1:107-15490(+)
MEGAGEGVPADKVATAGDESAAPAKMVALENLDNLCKGRLSDNDADSSLLKYCSVVKEGLDWKGEPLRTLLDSMKLLYYSVALADNISSELCILSTAVSTLIFKVLLSGQHDLEDLESASNCLTALLGLSPATSQLPDKPLLVEFEPKEIPLPPSFSSVSLKSGVLREGCSEAFEYVLKLLYPDSSDCCPLSAIMHEIISRSPAVAARVIQSLSILLSDWTTRYTSLSTTLLTQLINSCPESSDRSTIIKSTLVSALGTPTMMDGIHRLETTTQTWLSKILSESEVTHNTVDNLVILFSVISKVRASLQEHPAICIASTTPASLNLTATDKGVLIRPVGSKNDLRKLTAIVLSDSYINIPPSVKIKHPPTVHSDPKAPVQKREITIVLDFLKKVVSGDSTSGKPVLIGTKIVNLCLQYVVSMASNGSSLIIEEVTTLLEILTGPCQGMTDVTTLETVSLLFQSSIQGDYLTQVTTLLEEYLITTDKILRTNIPWLVLHLSAVITIKALKEGEQVLVNAFTERLMQSYCQMLTSREAEKIPPAEGIVTLLGILLDETSNNCPEAYKKLITLLATSLTTCSSFPSLEDGNFSAWGQALALLHMQLAEKEVVPQVIKKCRHKLLKNVIHDESDKQVQSVLLSPLRTSAVRTALASATGIKEKGEATEAVVAIPFGYSSSTPLKLDAEFYFPNGESTNPVISEDVVLALLRTATSACKPQSLPAVDRQGVFDLIQAASHLLWALTTLTRTTRSPESQLCLSHDDDFKFSEQTLQQICDDVSQAVSSTKSHTTIERIHLPILQLERYLTGTKCVNDLSFDNRNLIIETLTGAVEIMSESHAWTLVDTLSFMPNCESEDTTEWKQYRALRSILESGQGIEPAILRMLISTASTDDDDEEEGSEDDMVAGLCLQSPKSRQFAAIATAKTAVGQLSPGTWISELQNSVKKLTADLPQQLSPLLRHAAGRLVCKPGHGCFLYSASLCLDSSFRILQPLLLKSCKLSSFSLPRSLLTLSSALPYSAMPSSLPGKEYEGKPLSQVSLKVLSDCNTILPPGVTSVPKLVTAWKLHNLVDALGYIAAVTTSSTTGIKSMEDILIDLVKDLLSSYFKHPVQGNLVDPICEIFVKIITGEEVCSPSLCSLVLAATTEKASIRTVFTPVGCSTTASDIIKGCLRLLPCAGPSLLGKQLLLFAVAALDHPVGLETEREVLRDLLAHDPQQLINLVNGKLEEPSLDPASEQGICKRWLSTVISGDSELRKKCREVLLDGLPLCLSDNGFSYLSVCAEVCAGSDEKTLLFAVIKALRDVLSDATTEETTADKIPAIVPLLEFCKCALSAFVRVDSKGWFAQPASSLADALACLKFTHRAERSSITPSNSSGNDNVLPPVGKPVHLRHFPGSLVDTAIPEKYQTTFGCSFSKTQEQFVMMHWYLCYTAYPNEKQGACSWCAEYCHRRQGYDVEYAGCTPAYCDTQGVPPLVNGCSGEVDGILPHEVMDPFVLALFHQLPSTMNPIRPTRTGGKEPSTVIKVSQQPLDKVTLPADFILQEEDIVSIASDLTDLLQSCLGKGLPIAAAELKRVATHCESNGDSNPCILSGCDNWKTSVTSQQLLTNDHCVTLESVVDGKLEFDSMPHYEINLLQSRVLTRHVACSSLCGWVAVVDRSQCVLIVDEATSFPHQNPAPRRGDTKTELSVLSKCTVRFKIIGLSLNPLNGMYLAAYGIHSVQVFVIVGGNVTCQVTPHLSLSTLSRHTHVIHCEWVPGSHSQLAVITTKFVKIFDLSSTIYSPIHNLMLLDSDFCGATFAQDTDGSITMFGLTTTGIIYSQVLFDDSSADGPFYLTNQVTVPPKIGGDTGCSIYYSKILSTLCVSYTNGRAFFARWDFDKASLEDIVPLPSIVHDKSMWSVNHWEECPDAPGVIACILNDGANFGLVSIDRSQKSVTVEIVTQNLHGTHVEGLSLGRHRATAPVAQSGSSRMTKPSSHGYPHNDSLCLVASLENGSVCSYALDQTKINNILQHQLIPDQCQNDIDRQKSAVITARPLPRPRGRRPGGKVTSSRPDSERDRERETADDQDTDQHDPSEALLHGRPFTRGAPFDSIPSNTLRAMLAFDAKWGGSNSNKDIPSTVPLNVWEDLIPLGRSSWAITRGVGVTADDKDKLADGSDLTSVTIGPPRALSRSVEGGTSPPIKGLGVSPGTSPCNSPPLSPLSQRSSPPVVGLSPLPRAMSTEGRTPQLASLSGIGDARPAARFVLQASSDVIVCGVRLRLSCGKETLPTSVTKSPGEASLPPVDDQQISVRVATQTRTLPIDVDPSSRWLGFILSHREAMKSPKTGVEVSIVTNGPEVTLKQIELFTCVTVTKPRYEEGRASPEPDKDQVESMRDRVSRGREPVSPLMTASSTVDSLLQSLVSGRAASIARLTQSHFQSRRREEERRESRERQPSHPLGTPNPTADDQPTQQQQKSPSPSNTPPTDKTDPSTNDKSPPSPKQEPDAPSQAVRLVLKSTLDCARLAVSASPDVGLTWDTIVDLWRSVLSNASWGTSGIVANLASVDTLSALHLLFAAAKHDLQQFRRQRAEAFLDILLDGIPEDPNSVIILAVGLSLSTTYFSKVSMSSFVCDPTKRPAFKELLDVSLKLMTSDNASSKSSLPTQESILPVLYGMVIIELCTSLCLKDAAGESHAVDILVNAIQSPVQVVRLSVQHAIRRAIANPQLNDFENSDLDISWSRTSLFLSISSGLIKIIDKVPPLSSRHVACYYNTLLCVLSQVSYPTEDQLVGEEHRRQLNNTLSLLLSKCSSPNLHDTTNNIGRGFVTESQFMQMKILSMLLGANFHSNASIMFCSDKVDADSIAKNSFQVAKQLAGHFIDAEKQDILRQLVEQLILLKSSYITETDQPTGSNHLIPETPPVAETKQADDQGDYASTSHLVPPPFTFDLFTKSDVCNMKIHTLQPLFADSQSATDTSFSSSYNKHTLLAAIQFTVAIASAGTLYQLEDWKVLLDSALRKSHLKFIEPHITKLLVLLCDNSEEACQSYRNRLGLKSEFDLLQKTIKSEHSSQNNFTTVPINGVLAAYKSLELMTSVALNSNENWVSFCKDTPDAVPCLVELIKRKVPCELSAHTLRLYCLALKSEDGPRNSISPDVLELIIEAYHLTPQTEIASGLITSLSDKCPSKEVISDSRIEIVFLLRTICSFDPVLVCGVLLDVLPRCAPFGQRRTEFVGSLLHESLTTLDKLKPEESTKMVRRYQSLLASVVQEGGQAILQHPRTPLYLGVEHALGPLKSYPLEGGWARDNLPPQRLAEASLGILGAEIKYSPDTIFVRLATPIQLKRVMLLASECRQSKIPKTVHVCYSTGYTKDATTLKEAGFDWQLLGKMTVETPSQLCRAAVELPLAVNAHALKLHFSEFHCDSGAQLTETLTCPSCNQVITDRHGQCLNCEYENAYQCRQCRNINHDQLDAFLCNECGWCRYGRVDFSLLCRTALAPDVLRNEADRARAVQLLQEQNATAFQLTSQLSELTVTSSQLASNILLLENTSVPLPRTSHSSSRPSTASRSKHRQSPTDLSQSNSAAANNLASPTPGSEKTKTGNLTGSNDENNTEGINPSAACLASIYYTSAKDVSTQLAKCLRTQSALRRVISDYASRGNTTSAEVPEDELVECEAGQPPSRPNSPKPLNGGTDSVENALLLPTHFGALTQLVISFMESYKTLLSSGVGGIAKDCDSQLEKVLNLIETLYSLSLQAPEAVRTASRKLIVPLQEGNRTITERVLKLASQQLLPALCPSHGADYSNPSHLHSAALLLSKCASVTDGLWHVRIPTLMKVFLYSTSKVRTHPILLESIAQPALLVSAMLLSGRSLSDPQQPNNKDSEKQKTESEADTKNPLEVKYGRKWLSWWVLNREPELKGMIGCSWLVELLLAPGAASVSHHVRCTIEHLAPSDPELHSGLLKVLTENLPKAAMEGRTGGGASGSPSQKASDFSSTSSSLRVAGGTASYFGLFVSLIEPLWTRIVLTRKGFLPYLCKLVLREVYHLSGLERNLDKASGGDGIVPVELGWSLWRLVEILALFIPSASQDNQQGENAKPAVPDAPQVMYSRVLKSGRGVAMLLDASLTLKSISAVRTKPIRGAESLLRGILDTLVTESSSDKASFLSASINYLSKPMLPCQMGKHILEKVLNVVDPKPPEVVCQLLFKKKSSQEDFIRGHMGNSPVPSNTVGKVMGDVANRICRELDMQLDPDFGLELLVDSKIIDLKLPIQLVHDQVWKLSSAYKSNGVTGVPMLVVYRLQGLDGEATEERVDSLQEPEVIEEEPSVKYSVTECLSVGNDLIIAVTYVASICDLLSEAKKRTPPECKDSFEENFALEWELLVLTLRVLHHCCQVKANRVKLAKQKSLHVLLSAVDICGDSVGESAQTALRLLLSVAGSIAGEMGADTIDVDTGADQHLEFCLTHLQQHYESNVTSLNGELCWERFERRGLSKAEHHLYDVLRLISAVASGNIPAVARVESYFSPHALKRVNSEADEKSTFYTQSLAVIISGFGADSGSEIKKRLLGSGLAAKLIELIRESAKNAQKEDLEPQALPSVLRLTEALVRAPGECPEELFSLLLSSVSDVHTLECKSPKDAAKAATSLLDTLSTTSKGKNAVEVVRKQTQQTKHDAAMAKREKVMRDLNKSAHAELELTDSEDEDDEGLVCLICREVATFEPQDVLGIYIFARRIDILTNTMPSDTNWSMASLTSLSSPMRASAYSSVSHFNAIHFACHKEAAQIDASVRPAKREWEGATVRNLKTRCNAILPVIVEDTNVAQYQRYLMMYTDRIGITSGRGQLSVFDQSVYDLRMLLSRPCWGHPFSTDSNGGGPEHNFSLIPFLIQSSFYFLDSSEAEHERPKVASLLSQFVQGAATPFLFHFDTPSHANISSEFIFYLITTSIHVMSYHQWMNSKFDMVRSLVAYIMSSYVTKQGKSKPLRLVYGDVTPPSIPTQSAPHGLLTGLADRTRIEDFDEEGSEESTDWVSVHGQTTEVVTQSSYNIETDEGLLQFLKPSLVFVCLIDAIQKALKEPDESLPEASDELTSYQVQPWVTSLNKRLSSQQSKVVDSFKDIRKSVVEEFLPASSLQELFDILDILPLVLSEAQSPEVWVTQYCQ